MKFLIFFLKPTKEESWLSTRLKVLMRRLSTCTATGRERAASNQLREGLHSVAAPAWRTKLPLLCFTNMKQPGLLHRSLFPRKVPAWGGLIKLCEFHSKLIAKSKTEVHFAGNIRATKLKTRTFMNYYFLHLLSIKSGVMTQLTYSSTVRDGHFCSFSRRPICNLRCTALPTLGQPWRTSHPSGRLSSSLNAEGGRLFFHICHFVQNSLHIFTAVLELKFWIRKP